MHTFQLRPRSGVCMVPAPLMCRVWTIRRRGLENIQSAIVADPSRTVRQKGYNQASCRQDFSEFRTPRCKSLEWEIDSKNSTSSWRPLIDVSARMLRATATQPLPCPLLKPDNEAIYLISQGLFKFDSSMQTDSWVVLVVLTPRVWQRGVSLFGGGGTASVR